MKKKRLWNYYSFENLYYALVQIFPRQRGSNETLPLSNHGYHVDKLTKETLCSVGSWLLPLTQFRYINEKYGNFHRHSPVILYRERGPESGPSDEKPPGWVPGYNAAGHFWLWDCYAGGRYFRICYQGLIMINFYSDKAITVHLEIVLTYDLVSYNYSVS